MQFSLRTAMRRLSATTVPPHKTLALTIALVGSCVVPSLVQADAASDYRAAVLADNPVSYWQLNDRTGPTAVDEENRNPGQISGATLGEPGPFAGSGSMRFEGGGSVDLGHDPSLRPPTNWTIEAWFRASPTDAANCINTFDGSGCSLYAVHAFGVHLVLDPQGHAYGGFDAIASTNEQTYSVTSPNTYDDNAWHYVVLVRDTNRLTLYVDGAEVAATAVAVPTTYYCCENIATIANDDACGCVALWGWESEVAFYNYPLPATRIAAHYAAASPMPPPAPPLTVTTLAAANIGETFVTLTGTLNTYGLSAYYRFALDLGAVGSGGPLYFGFATPIQQALPVNGQQTVFATVSGLTPGTPYNFALEASNSNAFAASTLGNILAFQTAAPPMTKKDKDFLNLLLGAGATVVGGAFCAAGAASSAVTLGVSGYVGCGLTGVGVVTTGLSIADPPDPNYGTVFRPRPFPLYLRLPALCRHVHLPRGTGCVRLKRTALHYWNASGRVMSITEALAVTADRFGGAESAHSAPGEALQRPAILAYLTQLRAAVAASRTAGRRFASQLARVHYDPIFSVQQIERGRDNLRKLKGIPTAFIVRLIRDGIVSSTVELKQRIEQSLSEAGRPHRVDLRYLLTH